MKIYTMNDGQSIPAVGFGTYLAKDEEVYQAVRTALEAGYRHIDTAALYGNEASIGQAIRDSGLPREEIFVTTKLWNDAHGYEEAQAALAASLERLQLDYVDLYLVHWPNPLAIRDRWQAANAATWRAMEELQAAGKIKSIGVSNFLPHHLEELAKTARVTPAVNQVQLAPGAYQDEVVAYCREKGILLEAWAPLGQGELFEHPVLLEMAERYQTSVAKIALSWSWSQGFLPLPKSVTASRIVENLHFGEVVLEADDVERLKSISVEKGVRNPDQVNF